MATSVHTGQRLPYDLINELLPTTVHAIILGPLLLLPIKNVVSTSVTYRSSVGDTLFEFTTVDTENSLKFHVRDHTQWLPTGPIGWWYSDINTKIAAGSHVAWVHRDCASAETLFHDVYSVNTSFSSNSNVSISSTFISDYLSLAGINKNVLGLPWRALFKEIVDINSLAEVSVRTFSEKRSDYLIHFRPVFVSLNVPAQSVKINIANAWIILIDKIGESYALRPNPFTVIPIDKYSACVQYSSTDCDKLYPTTEVVAQVRQLCMRSEGSNFPPGRPEWRGLCTMSQGGAVWCDTELVNWCRKHPADSRCDCVSAVSNASDLKWKTFVTAYPENAEMPRACVFPACKLLSTTTDSYSGSLYGTKSMTETQKSATCSGIQQIKSQEINKRITRENETLQISLEKNRIDEVKNKYYQEQKNMQNMSKFLGIAVGISAIATLLYKVY